MITFLKRLVGRSEEHKAAEARYKKNLEKLAEREKELDALGEQLSGVSKQQKEKTEQLSKTSSELTEVLTNSVTPAPMKAVKEDEQRKDRHPEDPRKLVAVSGG